MKYMKMFELMGEINDKFFDENYDPPQHASYSVEVPQKRGVKRWIIPAAIGVAACLAVAIAVPRLIDALKDRSAIIDNVTSGATSADNTKLLEWFALPHNAINAADVDVTFSSDLIEDGYAILTFDGDVANDIYAVDDCTVKYTGYSNPPYLGQVVLVQFDNGLWGLYRNSYIHDDSYATEISVKEGDKLKAGDRIGTMYPYGFKLLISAAEPSAELFTPEYPDLSEWEKQHGTLPVAYFNPYNPEKTAPEYLTENLGYRGWHTRFYFINENDPAYAVVDGTVYAIDERTYPDGSISDNENEKTVVIKLDTDFDTPLYAIYDSLDGDELNIKVGDTVKEGDVIGEAFYGKFAAPPGMDLTISTLPYVPEVNDDGNFVSPDTFADWISEPHHSIDSAQNDVIFTPTEQSDNRALLTIDGEGLTDIYAIADCTVTRVRYANAPYLGKVVTVDFGNKIWGIYRSSYKYDESDSVEFAVKAGDKLKAGDRIGSVFADGFKLLIGRGSEPLDILSPKYPELAKWAKQISTTPPIKNVERTRNENIGYCGQYEETYSIDGSTLAYAVADGTVIDTGSSLYGGTYAVIRLDTLVGTLYARYDSFVTDSLTVKVGDTVKEGDALGDVFTSPDGGPVLFKLTVSVSPDTAVEFDDDGNVVDRSFLIKWISEPRHAIDSADDKVIFTPTEQSDDRVLLTIDKSDGTQDIRAIADCTVTRVGYAAAPLLGRTVTVDFGNGLWGIYRSSYKHDDLRWVEIAVKEGDKLKAGDRIGSMYTGGFKLLIGRGSEPLDLYSPQYPELAEYGSAQHTKPVTPQDGTDGERDILSEGLGYCGQYTDHYVIGNDFTAYAVSDGTVYAINDQKFPYPYNGNDEEYIIKKTLVIKLDTEFDTPLYAIYDYMEPDDLAVKVGDRVKEGAVLGEAAYFPDRAPEGLGLTISVFPERSELDEDGNLVTQGQAIVD